MMGNMDDVKQNKKYGNTPERLILCMGTADGKTYESDPYDPNNIPNKLILHEKNNSIYMGIG